MMANPQRRLSHAKTEDDVVSMLSSAPRVRRSSIASVVSNMDQRNQVMDNFSMREYQAKRQMLDAERQQKELEAWTRQLQLDTSQPSRKSDSKGNEVDSLNENEPEQKDEGEIENQNHTRCEGQEEYAKHEKPEETKERHGTYSDDCDLFDKEVKEILDARSDPSLDSPKPELRFINEPRGASSHKMDGSNSSDSDDYRPLRRQFGNISLSMNAKGATDVEANDDDDVDVDEDDEYTSAKDTWKNWVEKRRMEQEEYDRKVKEEQERVQRSVKEAKQQAERQMRDQARRSAREKLEEAQRRRSRRLRRRLSRHLSRGSYTSSSSASASASSRRTASEMDSSPRSDRSPPVTRQRSKVDPKMKSSSESNEESNASRARRRDDEVGSEARARRQGRGRDPPPGARDSEGPEGFAVALARERRPSTVSEASTTSRRSRVSFGGSESLPFDVLDDDDVEPIPYSRSTRTPSVASSIDSEASVRSQSKRKPSLIARLRQKMRGAERGSSRGRASMESTASEDDALRVTVLSVTLTPESSVMGRRDVFDLFMEVQWPIEWPPGRTPQRYQKPPSRLAVLEFDHNMVLPLGPRNHPQERRRLAYSLRRGLQPRLQFNLCSYSSEEPNAPPEILGRATLMLEDLLRQARDLRAEYLPLLSADGHEEVGYVAVNVQGHDVLRRIREEPLRRRRRSRTQ